MLETSTSLSNQNYNYSHPEYLLKDSKIWFPFLGYLLLK